MTSDDAPVGSAETIMTCKCGRGVVEPGAWGEMRLAGGPCFRIFPVALGSPTRPDLLSAHELDLSQNRPMTKFGTASCSTTLTMTHADDNSMWSPSLVPTSPK